MNTFNLRQYRAQPLKASEICADREKSELIVEMLSKDDATVCDLIFTSYSDRGGDHIDIVQHLSKNRVIIEKIQYLRRMCKEDEFSTIRMKHGLCYLPIYSKSVNMSKMSHKSIARVFHDAKEYLVNGAMTESELSWYLRFVMDECLSSFFHPDEIKAFLKKEGNLVAKLFSKTFPDANVFEENAYVSENFQITKIVRNMIIDRFGRNMSTRRFEEMVDTSVAKFLTCFALHLVTAHCTVFFDWKSRELDIFDREMYQRAIEEDEKNVRLKPVKRLLVDDDYLDNGECEIVETPRQEPIYVTLDENGDEIVEEPSKLPEENVQSDETSKGAGDTSSASENVVEGGEKEKEISQILQIVCETNDKPLLEDEMLRLLDSDPNISMEIKVAMRSTIAQNRMYRSEQQNFRDIIKYLMDKENKL